MHEASPSNPSSTLVLAEVLELGGREDVIVGQPAQLRAPIAGLGPCLVALNGNLIEERHVIERRMLFAPRARQLPRPAPSGKHQAYKGGGPVCCSSVNDKRGANTYPNTSPLG